MKTALYAGSFDPLTKGHLDIIMRGSNLFDKIIVGVAQNDQKSNFLPVKERISLIRECVCDLQNVEVCSYEGLTVNFAKEKNVSVLLRGLRNTTDFEYENQLAQNNALLAQDLETVFLLTKPEYACITSSGVKDILKNGGNITKFVPEPVQKYLSKFIS